MADREQTNVLVYYLKIFRPISSHTGGPCPGNMFQHFHNRLAAA